MEEHKVPAQATFLSTQAKTPSFFTFSTLAFHSRLHLGIYKFTKLKLKALPRMATSSKRQLTSMDDTFLSLRLSTCRCCSPHLKPAKLKSLVKPALPFSLPDAPILMATTLSVLPVAVATCHVSPPPRRRQWR